MKTLWIADMMADYIISHKGENYKIDLGLDIFITVCWKDDKLLNLWYETENTGECLGSKEYTVEEIKEILLNRMWVYEDDIEEINID